MRALALVLLVGCALELPANAHPATQAELAQVRDVVSRYAERWHVPQMCRDYAERAYVLAATPRELIDICHRCAPLGSGEEWCDRTRYGAAAACYAPHGDVPVLVVWSALEGTVFLDAVHHEATHAVGLCARIPGSSGHSAPDIWGVGGVHTL